jgi:predicted MPP superfamily phosphohydrolase
MSKSVSGECVSGESASEGKAKQPIDHRPRRRLSLTRRAVLGGLGFAGVFGTGTSAYAVGVEPLGLVVTPYRLTPPRWPRGQPLTVSVIADLHAGGPNMALSHIRRIVEVSNRLQPDLVVLLGDYIATHRFVTEHIPYQVWARELGNLRARYGVWAILGNHDWWQGVDRARRAFADVQIPVLENQAVHLGPRGRRFWLAGLGDQLAIRLAPGRFKGADDLAGTLARIDTPDPVLLLAHEPDIFPKVPDRVALTLAGHTHGGQIRVPFVGGHRVPSPHGARFAYGHVVENDRHMIVSGGLGTSIVPVRFGVPPEIVHLTVGA